MFRLTAAIKQPRRAAGALLRRLRRASRTNDGRACTVCGERRGYLKTPSHPRDGSPCAACGATSRDRMLVFGLGLCLGHGGPLADWPAQPGFTILETSGFRGHPGLLAQKFRYVNVLYDSPEGECIQGDVSRLPLRDETLDVVMTSDVFEHVRDDTAGFREIARALKPGGYLVLQAPAIGELERTRTLVETRDGQDIYLTEPRYHADNTLVYRYYGNDLLPRLEDAGLSALVMRREDASQVIAGQTVVIAQKASRISLGPREAGLRAWSYVPEIPAIEPRPADGRHGPASRKRLESAGETDQR